MTSTCADCPPGPSQTTHVTTSHPSTTTTGENRDGVAGPSTVSTEAAGPRAAGGAPQEAMFFPVPAYPSLTIEFCDRCRWAPRATWVQTELFLTFPTPMIKRITLIPLTLPETGGRFRVWLDLGVTGARDGEAEGTDAAKHAEDGVNGGVHLVWDRKTEGGFPELKVLKQRIRNLISPEMGLGHSDKSGTGEGVSRVPFGLPSNDKGDAAGKGLA